MKNKTKVEELDETLAAMQKQSASDGVIVAPIPQYRVLTFFSCPSSSRPNFGY